jgi:hypothetical protein
MSSPTQILGMSEYEEAMRSLKRLGASPRLASPAATHRDDVSAANSFRQADRNLSDGDGEAKGMSSVEPLSDPVPQVKPAEKPSQQPQERTAVAPERASAQ